MLALVFTIIGFAGAMSVPILLSAIVESATSNIRPASCANSAGGRGRRLEALSFGGVASSRGQ